MRLSDMPPRYRDQIAAKSAAELARLADADREEQPSAAPPAEREADLQLEVEQWLEGLGYWRRSASTIAAGRPPVGWQIHIIAAQKNPLILDLLLLNNDGTWLELELKTRPAARVATHQRQLIEQDPARRRLCFSISDVARAIDSATTTTNDNPRPRHD